MMYYSTKMCKYVGYISAWELHILLPHITPLVRSDIVCIWNSGRSDYE